MKRTIACLIVLGGSVALGQANPREEANQAMAAHDFARAAKLLIPLVQENPKDARLQYDLGAAEDALDQTAAAETSYRAAIADDSSLPDAHVALGLLLARRGEVVAAHGELVAATKVTGGDPELKGRAYRALARLDEKKDPEAAEAELLEALKLTPETPDDTLLAAELAAASPNGSKDAEAAYRRVLAARPDDPEASAGLAHLLVRGKRGAEAEPILVGALSKHPDDPALTAQLAALYDSEGRSEDAIGLVSRLHEAEPNDVNVTHMLAELYVKSRQDSKAEPLLATLTAAHPADTELAVERAQTLIHLKRYPEAQRLLAPLVSKPSLFPSPQLLGDAAGALAFACSENGDPAGALQALEVRGKVLPVSAPVLFLSAISHDKLRQTKLAIEAYKEFLAASNGSNPDEEFEARHRLVALEHTNR